MDEIRKIMSLTKKLPFVYLVTTYFARLSHARDGAEAELSVMLVCVYKNFQIFNSTGKTF